MSAAELTQELKQRGRALGFDLIGVAAADRLDRDGAVLEQWLSQGRQAGMHWMAREPAKRADPRQLLPGCRAVVVVAMNYDPGPRADRAPGRGWRARVARYALGRDYHKVMGRKLRELAAWLEQRSGQRARVFVDTGPVLERAWAERAGLGWIGKNANLIARELGSWLLLGEMLTCADLAADPGPHADFCGSCTACLAACPTQAIREPGVVDANRCISYWTIEHRGPVPEARRADVGDWIFGCDICQEVCPWSRSFGTPVPEQRFGRRADLEALDAAEILASDEHSFRARFSGTALMRAKWQGMRRNACLVLGNSGRDEALEVLATVLEDSDPVVRSHAAWAVSRIRGARAG
jgi:epoxyqueuosine reductase